MYVFVDVFIPVGAMVKLLRRPFFDDRLAFRAAKSAHAIDDQADQENQAKPAAANDGSTKVKSAAAEQEKQDNHE
jgi:hypothetical protein